MKVLFWSSFFIIFYTYVGYALVLMLVIGIKKLFRKKSNAPGDGSFLPNVALVVAAFNEEEFIEHKIANTFELDYPRELLELIFITDGSTDRTPEIISRFPTIKLLHQPERRGKVAAINRAIQFVKSPYVIFCDANTLLNKDSIKILVQHYRNPLVGGVAGKKKIITRVDDTASAVGEGLYWKYESFLKRLDSEVCTVVGAAGELFSIRTALFEPVPPDTIIEDFVLSLKLCVKGYKVKYEPKAYAAESPSESIKDEMKRKTRISAGAFQAIPLLKPLFNIFQYPVISFQFISHRILRWTLTPIALIIFFISSTVIAFLDQGTAYVLICVAQFFFYILAIIGLLYASKNVKIKMLYIPFYFLLMHMAVFIGFRKFIHKRQSVLWEKAARRKLA